MGAIVKYGYMILNLCMKSHYLSAFFGCVCIIRCDPLKIFVVLTKLKFLISYNNSFLGFSI